MAERAPVTVAIGHFDDLIARGLRGLVDDEPSLQLLAHAIPDAELDAVLRRRKPNVAILAYASFDAPASVRRLSSEHPATALVLLADHLSAAECAQLLAFGAAACLSRTTQARDVLNAVHMAARGLQLTPREFGEETIDSGALTPREAEVLAELQRGRANAQIASDLHISVETVRTHARSIYRKLGVSSRRELLGGDRGGTQGPADRAGAVAGGG